MLHVFCLILFSYINVLEQGKYSKTVIWDNIWDFDYCSIMIIKCIFLARLHHRYLTVLSTCLSWCFYLLGLHTNTTKEFFLSEIIIAHPSLVYIEYERTNSNNQNMSLWYKIYWVKYGSVCLNNLAFHWVCLLAMSLTFQSNNPQ